MELDDKLAPHFGKVQGKPVEVPVEEVPAEEEKPKQTKKSKEKSED